MIVLAHGVGSRAALPVPLTLALYGAGLAVLLGLLALLLWGRPSSAGDAAGSPLRIAVQAVIDSAITRSVLRAVVLVLTLVVAVALAGPPSRNDNLFRTPSTWRSGSASSR